MIFIHILVDVFFIINIDRCILTKSIIPLKYFFFCYDECYLKCLSQHKFLDWNMLAKDKMWNGSSWYGFIEVISTSTTDIK